MIGDKLLGDFDFDLVFVLENVFGFRVRDVSGVDVVDRRYDVTLAKATIFSLAAGIHLKQNINKIFFFILLYLFILFSSPII